MRKANLISRVCSLLLILLLLLGISLYGGQYEDCVNTAYAEYESCLNSVVYSMGSALLGGLWGGPITALISEGGVGGVMTYMCNIQYQNALRGCLAYANRP